MSAEMIFLPEEEIVTYDDLVERYDMKKNPPMAVRMMVRGQGLERKEFTLNELEGLQIFTQVPQVREGIPTDIRDRAFPEPHGSPEDERPPDGSYDLFKQSHTSTAGEAARWLIENAKKVPKHVGRWLGFFEGPLQPESRGGWAPLVVAESVSFRGKELTHLSAGNLPLGSPDAIELLMKNSRGEDVGRMIGYVGRPGKIRFLLHNILIMAMMTPKLLKEDDRRAFAALLRARGWF